MATIRKAEGRLPGSQNVILDNKFVQIPNDKKMNERNITHFCRLRTVQLEWTNSNVTPVDHYIDSGYSKPEYSIGKQPVIMS